MSETSTKGRTDKHVEIPSEYTETIKQIVEKAAEVGLMPYATGGFVRDLILGKRPKDLDIMVDICDKELFERELEKILDAALRAPKEFVQNALTGAKKVISVEYLTAIAEKGVRYINGKVVYEDKSKSSQPVVVVDADFSTTINPSLVFSSRFSDYMARGEAFGIYAVRTAIGEVEVAYPRTERYVSGSRHPKVKMGTFEQDALRRDFGMNALYIDLRDGILYDPTGHGLSDIEQRIIEVTDPENIETIFTDDPLRILRAIRQAGEHGFEISQTVWAYIVQHHYLIGIAGEETPTGFGSVFDGCLSAERVQGELTRILSLSTAADSLELLFRAFLMPHIIQVLEDVLPWDMDHKNPYHYETVWAHTMTVVRECNRIMDEESIDKETRFVVNCAAMLHDIGKRFPDEGHQNYYDDAGELIRRRYVGHPVVSTRVAIQAMKRLKYSSAVIQRVSSLVKWHDDILHLWPMRGTISTESYNEILAKMVQELRKDIYNLIILSRADRIAHTPPVNSDEKLVALKAQLLAGAYDDIERRLKPFVDGDFVMSEFKCKPGRFIGALLKMLVSAQIQFKINTITEAEAWIKEMRGKIKDIRDDAGNSLVVPLLDGTEILSIYREKDEKVIPGPWMRRVMNDLLLQQLSGEVTTKADAESAIRAETEASWLSATLIAEKEDNTERPVMTYWYALKGNE
jgi:poly(A) polymerase